ncbi:MAG TPA: hypothetical protein VE758_04470, partial [Chthoniobacterales bacterium]|nr:hypothetical protein [Chthoniobacterales bacterium]
MRTLRAIPLLSRSSTFKPIANSARYALDRKPPGVPDIGLLGIAEVVKLTAYIAQAEKIPAIV